MSFANLTYFVWSERLLGDIDGTHFSMRAVSGGGRGGLTPDSSMASYSPYRSKDEANETRGGTLPPGYYRVEKPSSYSGSIPGPPIAKLTPLVIDDPVPNTSSVATPYGRDFTIKPFLIHGPGVKGSDGCIVIDKTHRKPLLEAVEASSTTITLRVTTEDPDGVLSSPNLTVRA